MIYVLIIFTALASLLHIFIFYLETLAWGSPLANKTFGLSVKEAAQTKLMAANQGVYNLLLAFVALVGIVVFSTTNESAGLAFIIAGCGSMVGAALFLLFSSDKKSAALKQLAFPLLATVSAVAVLL